MKYAMKHYNGCKNINPRHGSQMFYAQLPLVLIQDERFSNVSYNEVILYSYLLNRLRLSMKNNFLDEDGYYLVMTQQEIGDDLRGVPTITIKRWMKQLKDHGLITTQRRGMGMSQKIYLTDLNTMMEDKAFEENAPEDEELELVSDDFKGVTFDTSEVSKTNQRGITFDQRGIADETLEVSPMIRDIEKERLEKERQEKEILKELSPKGDSKKKTLFDKSVPPPNVTSKRKRFVPPTINEIEDYAESQGMDIRDFGVKAECQKFLNYYEANGWKQGNQAKRIVNWKAAFRGWVIRAEKWKREKEEKEKPTEDYSWLDVNREW